MWDGVCIDQRKLLEIVTKVLMYTERVDVHLWHSLEV